MPVLLISVRFHDGRYHGSGDWPPSPARLFQALVAGAARGEKLSGQVVEALEWLERLNAPPIAAPTAYAGSSFNTYVPNNDLDAVGGCIERIQDIKAAKTIRPRLFDAAIPLLYAWRFEDGADAERHARTICQVAQDLYQLGRGVDMAWAIGDIVADEAEVEARLRAHGGRLWHPNEGGSGNTLLCPHPGSLTSLMERFEKMGKRFKTIDKGSRQLFSQAPKPNFRPVPYNSPDTFLLFEIKKGDAFVPQPLDRIVAITEKIRDLAAQRLKTSTWHSEDAKRDVCIEKVFIGRNAKDADKARRIRITPLPSIGHAQTERSIRRVLVTVPPDCPIAADDIAWAFSGVVVGSNKETGEIVELVPAADRTMLAHYGLENAAAARLWRSITPAALPEHAARRRIDPRRIQEEAKGGTERARENATAAMAVRQALRHADIDVPVQAIRVQREPFESKGKRAEAFAAGTRFPKERLWHVEIAFAQAVRGPLLIGDGRYLGLGLMAPVRRADGVFAFAIADGLADEPEPRLLTCALRRAVMARVQKEQEKSGRDSLPTFFTGHAADGAVSRPGRHEHLVFAFDAPRTRLLILAPHLLEHRDARRDECERYLPLLAAALEDFRELRAGAAGKLVLVPNAVDPSHDPLFAPSQTWRSLTPYCLTRHAKFRDAAAALEADLLAECLRVGLPRPRIEIADVHGKRGLGVFGHVRLFFRTAVAGPLILGRDRHFGGGLFVAAEEQ
jgi:CRISPR-associated protein Csb2